MSTTLVVTSKDLNTDLPASSRPVSARFGGGSSLESLAAAGCGIAASAPLPAIPENACSSCRRPPPSNFSDAGAASSGDLDLFRDHQRQESLLICFLAVFDSC